MTPHLFADRFLVVASGEAVDLGSGALVRLCPVRPSDRRRQEAWLRRCAALSEFWHPHVVPLVDYGAVGRAGFFEAWGCPARPVAWRGRDAMTAGAVSGAAAFLRSRAVAAGPVEWRSIIELSGRPALMPTRQTGLPLEAIDDRERGQWVVDLERMLAPWRHAGAAPPGVGVGGGHDGPGVEVWAGEMRDLVERVADVLEGGVAGRPREVRFPAPGGVVGRLAPLALARLARLHGYVPVAAALVEGGRSGAPEPAGWRAAIEGRHVMLLKAGGRPSESREHTAFWMSIGMSSDRPHVLLRLEEAACDTAGPGAVAVREEAAEYVTSVAAGQRNRGPWRSLPMPQTHAAGQRFRAIADALGQGRHARAERLLRELTGYCERRHEDAAAGESALALGRLLLVRGQPAEAFRMLESARRHFEQARCGPGGVRAAVFAGLAWTDEGRLRESEGTLRAARIAAADLHEAALEEFATLALARCLYWQERFSEAWDCLAGSPGGPRVTTGGPSDPQVREWTRLGGVSGARERLHGAIAPLTSPGGTASGWPAGEMGLDVAWRCLASRIALAMGEVASAGRLAAAAKERAAHAGSPAELSAACCAQASVYGVLGDIPAVRAVVQEGIDAARSAHAPLRALRLRIVLAGALRGGGRGAEAGTLLSRLARIDSARLPKVVAIPLERMIRGEVSGAAVGSGVAALAGGRPALAALTRSAAAPGPAVVDAVVEVLGVCQSSEDEAAVLQRVAACLRECMHAASVACFGRDGDLAWVLAADGRRARAEEVARRAIDSGLPIAPTATASGLEAAAPIKFAGTVVGAFGCRWAADNPPDWAVAGSILAAAAAAVSPCVRSELDRRTAPVESSEDSSGELVGTSEAMAGLRREIARAARAPFNVVIEGESGSGKELVARAIHRLGPRRLAPLCALNCAALADELVEAELFGHARGAFTGAVAERKGLFEEADGGTLVLDEVGELSARAQAKLLRAIQEGEVRRVGENLTRSVDVRIVAATNRCLRTAVEAGTFRSDLRYRLEVIRVVVPPLRAHAEDIPALAAHFWRQAASRVGSRSVLAPETVAALARYDWPGNVRELQNVMAALAAATGARGSVGPELLPAVIAGQRLDSDGESLDEARRRFEVRFVRAALARAGGRRALAAGELGLTRQGLAKLMARLGIE